MWVEKLQDSDPDFFLNLSLQQTPMYLWIGCSDSRVPANEIVGLMPGELFVHRNIANLIVHTDLNCLSVIQFAVDLLKVKHIIVCGHYGCSGVKAAFKKDRIGLCDIWLRHILDVRKKYKERLPRIGGDEAGVNRLCELNVIEQVVNLCQTTIVTDAWERGQSLTTHGWIYGLKDGLLKDLHATISNSKEVESVFRHALAALEKHDP